MKESLAVYLVHDGSGLLTGRLIARGFAAQPFVATGESEDSVLEQLRTQILIANEEDPDVLEPYQWSEALQMARVKVNVRPQTIVQKRSVIGKEAIPLTLTYAWAAIGDDRKTRAPAGYRVLLPRFGWSFVLEDLSIAGDVLRQALSAELSGQSTRSLFEFREAARESVIEWRPKLRARRPESDANRGDFATLHEVAEDWSALARSGRLSTHYAASDGEIFEAVLAPENKPALLLIGPSGVGKTEWVRELARRVARSDEETRLWATSADRIMAGMQYLGMWEQRCLDVVAELSGEGHWLYVDRLSALAQQQTGASSIADLFLPALQDGEIALIAECTEEELAKLAVDAPAMVACFRMLRLEPPTSEKMAAFFANFEQRRNPAWRLHPDATRRLVRHLGLYRKDHAFPGKAMAFLAWLEREQPAGATRKLLPRDVDALFSRYSGLPEKLISDDESGDVESLTTELTKHVIGQERACSVCAAVLARFKAGINDPDKPMGSLLFVGPTGVGKTELAKQLARFVFGGSERLIRLDMSEYLLGGSIYRLLSDERGSESLAQRVSREPLSLVLFDEIEKAHPAVFDLLLGVLGEGRLTTSSGRLVDFRMTLIVMTSNLGTDSVRAGFDLAGSDPRDAVRAVRDHFRPEFFNRIDYVVAFSELSREALLRIVALELDAAAQREGLRRREIRLEVSAEAKARLAELGFHPKYGARPLKRVIEDRVMTPIAVELARRPKLTRRHVAVTLEDGAIRVAFE